MKPIMSLPGLGGRDLGVEVGVWHGQGGILGFIIDNSLFRNIKKYVSSKARYFRRQFSTHLVSPVLLSPLFFPHPRLFDPGRKEVGEREERRS